MRASVPLGAAPTAEASWTYAYEASQEHRHDAWPLYAAQQQHCADSYSAASSFYDAHDDGYG